MLKSLTQNVTNYPLILGIVVAIAVFATLYTLIMPYLDRGDFQKRMKSVSTERDKIRAKERERLNSVDKVSRSSLRYSQNVKVTSIVDKFNLRKALVDEDTVNKLKAAGYRSQNALNIFLMSRLLLPFGFLGVSIFYIYFLGALPNQPPMIRFIVVILSGYFGFFLPNIFIKNAIDKRQKSITRAWPDALDLMLICVESGQSIEAGMRRVSEEMVTQSPALAEEMILTTAELSYLQDRRTAFENLALRTRLESVKSVVQALIQAERYGTPIAQALRVLAQVSRDDRMAEAEKKAAALPPKLTVPMIVFFLPVLVAVLLGPAGIGVSDAFGN